MQKIEEDEPNLIKYGFGFVAFVGTPGGEYRWSTYLNGLVGGMAS